MKSAKFVMILLSILVVLAASYFLIEYSGKPDAEDGDTKEYVINLAVEDIEKVTVVNEGETYVIERYAAGAAETSETTEATGEEEKWILTYPENFDYDPAKLKNIVYNAYSITAERVVEEEAADLVQYGLDEPVSVTIKTYDGSEYTIEVGDLTPTGGARYVKMKESARIYTMGTYSAGLLAFDKNYIRTTQIYDLSADDIINLALYNYDELSYEISKDTEGSWNIEFPVIAEADSEIMAEITGSLADLYVAEYVAGSPGPLAEYGLDDPKYTLEFETETSGKATLKLGKDDGTNIYAQYNGNGEVIKIPLSGLGFLDKPLREIVYSFVYLTDIDNVSEMQVIMDGYTLNITMETGNEDSSYDRFYINGRDASMTDENNKQKFRSYYEALMGLQIADVAPDEDPSGEPEITISYTLKEDPYVMKLEFVSKDSIYYYVFKNGIYSGLLFEKSDLDMDESSYGVRAMYNMLMDFINNYKESAGTSE